MKIQMKKVAWDDFVIIVLELILAGILVSIFGPISLAVAYLFVAFFHEAAERQGPIGVVALYVMTFILFFGMMIAWWYFVLSGVTGIPFSKEC